MRMARNGSAPYHKLFARRLQNRDAPSSVSSAASYASQEIVMTSPRKRLGLEKLGLEKLGLEKLALAPFAIAAGSAATSLLWANDTFASQGPGGGLGTASAFTQTAMAVIVWGISALVLGAGLFGAMRRR
jgi:hypothetical protein